MKSHIMKINRVLLLFIALIISTSSLASQKDQLIPRSMSGDKGKYFLLEKKKSGNIIKTLHKRVGVYETGYTRTEINCSTRQIRVIGYSEKSPSEIKVNPTKWFALVSGSSKSDLVNFVCR